MENLNFILALTIKERFEAFRQAGVKVFDDPILVDAKWFNVRNLMDSQLFQEKLNHMGMDKSQFAYLIKDFSNYEKNILYHYLEKQEWYCKFCTFFEEYRKSYLQIKMVQNQFVKPFYLYIKETLKGIKLKNIKVKVDVWKVFEKSLSLQLEALAWKCIIQEFDGYVKEKYPAYKETSGNERYLEFVKEKLYAPDKLLEFYVKYPVLARVMTQKMLNSLQAFTEMMYHFDFYFSDINNALNLENSEITEIKTSLGDTHKRGKAVAVIQFKNGKRCVYKPRNGFCGKAFYELLDDINKCGKLKDLYINLAYYQPDFTVENFVSSKPCKTEQEVEDYYYRYGELLALAGMLHGSDIHSENLVASGAYPVIIDLETFFSGLDGNQYMVREEISQGNEIFHLELSGMLPMQGMANNVEKKGIDISALTGGDYSKSSQKQFVIQDLYMDTMRYEYKNMSKPMDCNKPIQNGMTIEFQPYKEAIIQGFEDTVNFFKDNREKILSIVKEKFNNLEVRIVAKSTCIYADLLSYANHPAYFSNMMCLERLFDNSYAYPHKDKTIIKYEIDDLLNFEIPIFYAGTDDTYLKSSTGEKMKDFYKISPLESVLLGIENINAAAIAYEKEKLQILLGNYLELAAEHMNCLSRLYSDEKESNYLKKEDMLSVCENIAQDIIKAADTVKDTILWKTVNIASGDYPEIVWMNESMYNGRFGIWWFLYQLNKHNKNDRIEEFSKHLFNNLQNGEYEKSSNIFEKEGAEIYFLKNDLENHGAALNRIIDRILKYDITDSCAWLDGISGYGLVAARIYEKNPQNPKLYTVLKYIADKMTELDPYKMSNGDAVGLAHGVIGVLLLAYMLECLLHISMRDLINKLHNAIKKSLDKNTESGIPLETSWCRGLSGLGLGAMECKRYSRDPRLDNYINLAKTSVLGGISVTNMCLCHGTAGEIEFLLQLEKSGSDQSVREALEKRIRKIVWFYKKYHNEILLETTHFKDYSLFTGLTGIGYELLRVLYNDVPNILVLE